mmetsp:Transcript_13955/g.22462  ORF Transcript_13955/g.22462 Transcript_13955/m.22462 type:complete len:84 (-) Transcript_13955:77-328(-)
MLSLAKKTSREIGETATAFVLCCALIAEEHDSMQLQTYNVTSADQKEPDPRQFAKAGFAISVSLRNLTGHLLSQLCNQYPIAG